MLLKCSELSFQFPSSENPLFTGLSCSLSSPGFHGLFGLSGVGKSTLAKIIAGELNGFSGKVSTEDLHTILYSNNLERLPGWSSVGGHIAKVIPADHRSGMDELVNSFGLRDCLDSRFSQLSLGQKNRANLTRYLLQDFDLLVMDESLANVDEATRELIILKMKELFPHKCFLYISHSVLEVSKFCDTILVLRPFQKTPQIIDVEGCNYKEGQDLDKRYLEQTMLEIVNVS